MLVLVSKWPACILYLLYSSSHDLMFSEAKMWSFKTDFIPKQQKAHIDHFNKEWGEGEKETEQGFCWTC